MKLHVLLASFLATASASLHAANFTAGNLVVSRVGDGAAALVNSAGALSILEFTSAGAAVQTITIPTTTLQVSGTATSEGALSLSKDKTRVTIAGYISPFAGTGSLSSRTDANAPRGYVNIGANGTVGSSVAVGAFSGGNIRAAVTDGSGAWLAGSNTGTVYNNGANTTVQSTVTNTRVVNIINDTLYFSTGSGTQGVYGFTGTPSAASTATLLIAASNVYDFAFNSAGDVAYVAANSGAANGTITRFTFSGGVWSAGTSISAGINGVTGLAVDFGAAGETIYAVTPSSLVSIGYTVASGSYGSVNTLATAGGNYAFRGLEFAPSVSAVPEPASAAALAGLGMLGFAASRRRRVG